jgi:uncharacterized paraquat-inducible protein A
MTDIARLKSEGWGNCPNCDWFYRQKDRPECPMCRHPHALPKSYQQPPYENPTLE